MSQWGTVLIFKRDEGSYVKAIAHVRTNAFAPAQPSDIIDLVIVAEDYGPDTEILKQHAKSYEGKPYREWTRMEYT